MTKLDIIFVSREAASAARFAFRALRGIIAVYDLSLTPVIVVLALFDGDGRMNARGTYSKLVWNS